MTTLKIADIRAIDPEGHLDPKRVEHYRHSIDQLPPVVVFATDEGLLLADGYHRLAAAQKEGRDTIEAEVRTGSRHEALEYAVVVGAAQRGLSTEEVRLRILGRRLQP
jgi:ParB-like chromosome segregation protein Spo0J